MSLEAIQTCISWICKAYGAATTINDILNPVVPLTLADINNQLQSTHAHYFQGDHISTLTYCQRTFCNVIRPSIRRAGTITQASLSQGGTLRSTYDELIKCIRDFNVALEKLHWLPTSNDLHVDIRIRLTRIFTEAYALLILMQCTYSHLHSIEVGCASLDDPDLYPDTLASFGYVQDAITRISEQRSTTVRKRLEMIQHVKVETFIGFGLGNTYYVDRYRPLDGSITQSTLVHTGGSSDDHESHPEAGWKIQRATNNNDPNEIRQPRYSMWGLQIRKSQTCYAIDVRGGDNALKSIAMFDELRVNLLKRLKLQGDSPDYKVFIPKRTVLSSQASHEIYSNSRENERLRAICETTLTRIEWVKVDAKLGNSKAQEYERGRRVRYETCATWQDNDYYDSLAMDSVSGTVIRNLTLRVGNETIGFQDFDSHVVEHETKADKENVYQRVFSFKTRVWFHLHAWGEDWVPGTPKYKPRVREISWKIYSKEVRCWNEVLSGATEVQVTEVGRSVRLEDITRRKLETCPAICKEILCDEYGLITETVYGLR
ncbi:uncharacterized protein GGS22DRAFT_171324 [Annulohypoxylon maeteangense]|uniref:uncharacterized protein n=1 Tax=Annulohypoxylon maeteangense TaxID=1927788 RepID=UPI0020086EBC|nr:uncharacterized protein GGS22DRAFT_171324 [Annulohypoxylon maeteangense]KAI0882008.1 hypothetical protein GGS22DRAFT_171324 [Annulohypoxylon maeteangense]